MSSWAVSLALATASLFIDSVLSKDVFAHYMVVGPITEAHAHQDIDDAMAMNLDGFALNIGDPTQSYLTDDLSSLFGYAAYVGFKLFISIDASELCAPSYADDEPCNLLTEYDSILSEYLGSSAWYKGPNGFAMISTYSAGGLTNTQWQTWKQSLNTSIYFIPDFDETEGYYSAASGWYDYWGEVVDGLFSWEAAWPLLGGYGGLYPGDISPDLPVIAGAKQHDLGYMIALSTLQYKDSYNTNLYRAGELNLPTRMQNILGMSPQPDLVEIITWNDGPEGHYIGNLWLEENDDPQGLVYATQAQFPHNDWQQIITPFIEAFKTGGSISSMVPPQDLPAVGTLWYKTILQDADCPNNTVGLYGEQPRDFNTGYDVLNWALVLPANSSGMHISGISNNVTLGTGDLVPGFNFGAFGGVQAGSQVLNLIDSTGAVVMSAMNGTEVSTGCPDGIYNMNYQVIGLAISSPRAYCAWAQSQSCASEL